MPGYLLVLLREVDESENGGKALNNFSDDWQRLKIDRKIYEAILRRAVPERSPRLRKMATRQQVTAGETASLW